jgi:hypothetical protein
MVVGGRSARQTGPVTEESPPLDPTHRTPEAPPSGVPRWPATVALLVVGGLLALVSSRLTLGPPWVPLAVAAVLAIPLTIASLRERHDWRRALAFVGLGTVTVAVAASAIFLVRQLLEGPVDGSYLLSGAGAIWAANLLTFTLWYWEIDGGGPSERRRDGHVSTDFLFPQMQIGNGKAIGWWPGFLDYMFVAFNASTAFSPTDTLILSRRAKVLMMVQALIAAVTVVVIAARAINTLG